MYQHVNAPTRGKGSHKPSTLDLILTNEEEMVVDLIVDSPIGKSDHSLLRFSFKAYCIPKKTSVDQRYNFDEGDYLEMAKILNINWTDKFEWCNNEVNKQWEVFKKILNWQQSLFRRDMEEEKEACAVEDFQCHWIIKQLLRLKGNKDFGVGILKQRIMKSICNIVR